MTQHHFLTTLWTQLNYKRPWDLVGIILLRKTKKKKNGRKRWASFIVSHPHINKWGGKQNKKQKFMVSMEGMATDGYERRRKRKSNWRCWKIQGAVMTIYLTRISLIKFTLLHPWRNQHQQSTGTTWQIIECLNTHKIGAPKHPQMVESAMQLDFLETPLN